jgi:hypothetical protein
MPNPASVKQARRQVKMNRQNLKRPPPTRQDIWLGIPPQAGPFSNAALFIFTLLTETGILFSEM